MFDKVIAMCLVSPFLLGHGVYHQLQVIMNLFTKCQFLMTAFLSHRQWANTCICGTFGSEYKRNTTHFPWMC